MTFTVYTRENCCLCDQALALLAARQPRHGFAIETIDVDTDPALVATHGDWVPVITVEGKVRFRGRIDPVLLDRLLADGRGSA